MFGKVCVCSQIACDRGEFSCFRSEFCAKKKRHHIVVMPLLCTLSGVRTLDPLIKSQLLYQLS